MTDRKSHWDAKTVVGDAPVNPKLVAAPENPFKGHTAIWHMPEPTVVLRLEPPTLTTPRPAPAANSEPADELDDELMASFLRGPEPAPRKSIAASALSYARRELARTPPAIRWTLLALPAIAWVTLEPSSPAPAHAAAAPAPAPVQEVREPAPSAEPPAVASQAPPVVQAATAKKPRARAATPGRRTLEARAADAAARGAWSEAATLYQDLAELHPERSAFASAARILRSR